MTSPDNPNKPGPRLVQPGEELAIPKPPEEFSLERFRSKRDLTIGGVATLLTGLPHHPISQAKDFVRLHSNQADYWTPELCFVPVPIKGMKRDTLHMIDEEIALAHLPGASGTLQRVRLALASKPHDAFFLCHVPSQNLDNAWNYTNLTACETAMQWWVKATSRRAENIDGYLITHAVNAQAFPEPKWPKQTLTELIKAAFSDGQRMITTANHPAILRLRGDVQDLTCKTSSAALLPISSTKPKAETTISAPVTSRYRYAWLPMNSTVILITFAPFACGAMTC